MKILKILILIIEFIFVSNICYSEIINVLSDNDYSDSRILNIKTSDNYFILDMNNSIYGNNTHYGNEYFYWLYVYNLTIINVSSYSVNGTVTADDFCFTGDGCIYDIFAIPDTCPYNYVVQNTTLSGVDCILLPSEGSSYDQDLNRSSNVTFNIVNVTNITTNFILFNDNKVSITRNESLIVITPQDSLLIKFPDGSSMNFSHSVDGHPMLDPRFIDGVTNVMVQKGGAFYVSDKEIHLYFTGLPPTYSNPMSFHYPAPVLNNTLFFEGGNFGAMYEDNLSGALGIYGKSSGISNARRGGHVAWYFGSTLRYNQVIEGWSYATQNKSIAFDLIDQRSATTYGNSEIFFNGAARFQNITINNTIYAKNINFTLKLNSNGREGISINITVLKDADLIGLTKTYCSMNFSNGILYNTTC